MNPSNNLSISSMVLIETPDSQTFPNMSSCVAGSWPYRLGESKATESLLKGWSLAKKWYLSLVLSAEPSPANIRTGSSSSRLKGKTPAVYGKAPGRFSDRIHLTRSPQSDAVGSATLGRSNPDSVFLVVLTSILFPLTR